MRVLRACRGRPGELARRLALWGCLGLGLGLPGAPAWAHAALASVCAPDTTGALDLHAFQALDAQAQGACLQQLTVNGTLAALPDVPLLALIRATRPEGFIDYMRRAVGPDQAYEYLMRRRERRMGKWPRQADHMDVRYQQTPRRIYAKWLPDGAHAGQEIIYDETRDPARVIGHYGGALHLLSGSFAVDGFVAHLQSRHSVRDLGLQFAVRMLERDARNFAAQGLSAAPSHIQVAHARGMRELMLTWDAPSGPPAYYAARVRLCFDLHHGWPRSETAWDENGTQLENVVLESVTPKSWTDQTFDPRNPAYRFR